MAKKVEQFEFRIQAYSPETIPMARLAEYMADLARLLGDVNRVHFVRLRTGSTALVHNIESEAVVTATHRARIANSEDAPADVKAAATQLKNRLRLDRAKGARLTNSDGEKILEFKVSSSEQPEYPTVSESGYVQGQVIRLGGSGEWVPVHLEDLDGRTYICEAKKEKTKELAAYYLNGLIRAKGTGRWSRVEGGGWDLENFRIHDFAKVLDESLLESIDRMRAIPAKWKDGNDALQLLDEVRHGRQV